MSNELSKEEAELVDFFIERAHQRVGESVTVDDVVEQAKEFYSTGARLLADKNKMGVARNIIFRKIAF